MRISDLYSNPGDTSLRSATALKVKPLEPIDPSRVDRLILDIARNRMAKGEVLLRTKPSLKRGLLLDQGIKHQLPASLFSNQAQRA